MISEILVAETMTFANEHIPPLEEETSEFLREARGRLRTGYTPFDRWTVDRQNDMVLFKRGSGRFIESKDVEFWTFIDRKGQYDFETIKRAETEISKEEIALTRLIGFQIGKGITEPDVESLAQVKDALREYKDYGYLSDYLRCRLTLVSAATGKEI